MYIVLIEKKGGVLGFESLVVRDPSLLIARLEGIYVVDERLRVGRRCLGVDGLVVGAYCSVESRQHVECS